MIVRRRTRWSWVCIEIEWALGWVRWRGLVCRNRPTWASIGNGRWTEMMKMKIKSKSIEILSTMNFRNQDHLQDQLQDAVFMHEVKFTQYFNLHAVSSLASFTCTFHISAVASWQNTTTLFKLCLKANLCAKCEAYKMLKTPGYGHILKNEE